ncbi:MAG: PfkB family carbohydrate kinase [Pasteurellaceae bacterium]|nr:PfkB family carbohydrate kinase [Pasteurellaceae bacterium]
MNMAEQKVVVIGGTNMDINGYVNAPLIYGDSNLGKIKCTPGGVGRNIAQNVAMLGKETHLISVVGDDLYGKTLLERTAQSGVNVDKCYTLSHKTTSTYLSLLDHQGEMVAAINDMQIIDCFTPDLLAPHLDFIQQADVLILDCNLSEQTLGWIIEHCPDNAIFVDTVSTVKALKIQPWLSQIHTLKPNRIEAETLSGIKIHNNADIERVADWFHQQGIEHIALSLGKEGVFYSEKDGVTGWSTPFNIEVINVTGAGDAMMAGLAVSWLDKRHLPSSIRYAQACSALALSSEFTNNPNLSNDQVLNLMEVQQ